MDLSTDTDTEKNRNAIEKLLYFVTAQLAVQTSHWFTRTYFRDMRVGGVNICNMASLPHCQLPCRCWVTFPKQECLEISLFVPKMVSFHHPGSFSLPGFFRNSKHKYIWNINIKSNGVYDCVCVCVCFSCIYKDLFCSSFFLFFSISGTLLVSFGEIYFSLCLHYSQQTI